MPTTPTASHPAPPATVRDRFRAFLAARIGSDAKVTAFLAHRLLPTLYSATASDDALVEQWFEHAFQDAFMDHIGSPLTPAERARVWLAVGSSSPTEEANTLHACVAHVIGTLPLPTATVLRLVDLEGASLWTAGSALNLSANAVWIRLRNGRADCRARLIQFLQDCTAESALADDGQIAAIA